MPREQKISFGEMRESGVLILSTPLAVAGEIDEDG
jgi:hypothetical protein